MNLYEFSSYQTHTQPQNKFKFGEEDPVKEALDVLEADTDDDHLVVQFMQVRQSVHNMPNQFRIAMLMWRVFFYSLSFFSYLRRFQLCQKGHRKQGEWGNKKGPKFKMKVVDDHKEGLRSRSEINIKDKKQEVSFENFTNSK